MVASQVYTAHNPSGMAHPEDSGKPLAGELVHCPEAEGGLWKGPSPPPLRSNPNSSPSGTLHFCASTP